jgi:hypothetical protein
MVQDQSVLLLISRVSAWTFHPSCCYVPSRPIISMQTV